MSEQLRCPCCGQPVDRIPENKIVLDTTEAQIIWNPAANASPPSVPYLGPFSRLAKFGPEPEEASAK